MVLTVISCVCLDNWLPLSGAQIFYSVKHDNPKALSKRTHVVTFPKGKGSQRADMSGSLGWQGVTVGVGWG